MVWIRTLAIYKSGELVSAFHLPIADYAGPTLDPDLYHLLLINTDSLPIFTSYDFSVSTSNTHPYAPNGFRMHCRICPGPTGPHQTLSLSYLSCTASMPQSRTRTVGLGGQHSSWIPSKPLGELDTYPFYTGSYWRNSRLYRHGGCEIGVCTIRGPRHYSPKPKNEVNWSAGWEFYGWYGRQRLVG